MPNKNRMQDKTSGIDTPSWGLAILGAVVTLLWNTADFTLWQSMIGITLVLLISALAERSMFTNKAFLAYCSIKAICYIIAFGVLIQLLLESLPSRDWQFTIHNFTISFGPFIYFVIWIIFGNVIYAKERSHKLRS
jgi:hypothetical protein